VQSNEQTAVADAYVVFNALPAATQSSGSGPFNTALRDLNTADQTFIDTVNAVVAGRQGNLTLAIADLISAADNFYKTFEAIVGSTPNVASPAASSNADIQTQIRNMKATKQSLPQ
jgi:hypothetical protein